MDNGPENNSHRTQFIKRIVDFVYTYGVNIKLAYYPPYHSKYNPIERVWSVLENHWNGEILYSIEKTLGLSRTMTYNGINPVVELNKKNYPLGVKLDQKTMNCYEKKLFVYKDRSIGLLTSHFITKLNFGMIIFFRVGNMMKWMLFGNLCPTVAPADR